MEYATTSNKNVHLVNEANFCEASVPDGKALLININGLNRV